MKIRGFVLGVILLALVGWCMIFESVKQTEARYKLADLARQEEDMKRTLARLRTKEQELRSPVRLAEIIREQRMPLVALGSVLPTERVNHERRPGLTVEDDLARKERIFAEDTDVASITGW
ncbi:MAG: hypothetical protein LIQ31_10540 [Planctomycetes bacterium]|nr:hypothetical protein [Planctomycetota bacterium]